MKDPITLHINRADLEQAARAARRATEHLARVDPETARMLAARRHGALTDSEVIPSPASTTDEAGSEHPAPDPAASLSSAEHDGVTRGR